MINPARAIIFGEVLFDTFPDGTAVLGGAPFNVAWHLQGFGLGVGWMGGREKRGLPLLLDSALDI